MLLTAQWPSVVGWVVRCYHVFRSVAPGAGAVGTLELRTGRNTMRNAVSVPSASSKPDTRPHKAGRVVFTG